MGGVPGAAGVAAPRPVDAERAARREALLHRLAVARSVRRAARRATRPLRAR